MALANDPAFLIYQLRVSFLRSNDPTGERILTFDDLSAAPMGMGPGNTRARQGSSTPSPLMTPSLGRRNTSASEVRHHVAQNTAVNPYIAACGYYPETEVVGSPEIEYDERYMCSRPAAPRWGAYGVGTGVDGADMPTPSARNLPDRAGNAGRNKRSNRSAKVAPTNGGGGQVVGLGVLPQDHELLLANIDPHGGTHDVDQQPLTATRRSFDTMRSRPLPVVQEVANSSGSISDGGGTGGFSGGIGKTGSSGEHNTDAESIREWAPKPIVVPPRRSLDTIHHRSESNAPQSAATGSRRHQGHAHSNSVATIRLQRPAEMTRKGSSRDAIALGIDFDVKTIFEKGASDGHQSIYDHRYQTPQGQKTEKGSKTQSAKEESSKPGVSLLPKQKDGGATSLEAIESIAARQPQTQGRDGITQPAKKSAGSIELRSKRGDLPLKIPLANLRDDHGSGTVAPSLKRSVTLPTKRRGPGGGVGGASSAARRSKWAGAYAFGRKQQQGANQASGWVDGAQETSWDQSSDEDNGGADAGVPLSRRGGGTQTWYGPRAGFRPISMFPPPKANAQYPIPPVPLMFGADDSDDDIDLEGDEGSSRTPALMGLGLGRGLRPQAASPSPSAWSRRESVGADAEKPRAVRPASKPTGLAASGPTYSPLTSTLATPTLVSGAKYSHLIQDANLLRPRGVSDPEGRQSSRASRNRFSGDAGASAESHSGAESSRNEESQPAMPALGLTLRQDLLRPASSKGELLLSSRALAFGMDSAGSARQLPHQTGAACDGAVMTEFVPPSPPKTSGIGALLSGKVEIHVNPFSEEFSAVGGNGNNGNNGNNSLLEVKLQFVQHSDGKSAPLTVHVRRNATVEQTVGYALFQYIEQSVKPQLATDTQDVVMWVLRIVEDGEVDDDLPALERTRPVANFAFDDLALCLATPEQIKQNEGVRERLGRPSRMVRPKSLLPSAPVSATSNPVSKQQKGPSDTTTGKQDTRYRKPPRSQPAVAVLQVSRMATTSMASIFVGNSLFDRRKTTMLLPPLSKGVLSGQSIVAPDAAYAEVAAALCEPRLLKIRILGEAKTSEESLRATTVETDTGATMGMVLAQVCRKKPFSEDRYVLGVIGATGFVVFDSEMRVSQIPEGAELCLYKVGTEQSSMEDNDAGESLSGVQDSERLPMFSQQWAGEGAVAMGAMAGEAGEAAMSSIYYTFRVFRRAQMFTRHERSLVIDGGVLTLMPSGHRTESAKTLTFHVSNIICKRNQKSPKKIRLFVTRRANTDEKSIDLETNTEEEATNICTILTRMHEYYVATGA
ncbi:Component of a membrane-bound complex containing the Tor2p kinase [Coemansia sp. RSA 1939]|nr:Component of a membrane-bound complex containing the Tor2p kinase [Coemansia sp. RSA 1939]KAJ2609252.1 Component of a membrane-bound complex containing the Tor2p kinase [Coemansia sp. RSA 1804]